MPKSFKWILVAALSGFLFGFDTVVISGANLPIKDLWSTSPFFHGFFIMSMALWGTVLGALFGAYPSNKFGRKNPQLDWYFFSDFCFGFCFSYGSLHFSFLDLSGD